MNAAPARHPSTLLPGLGAGSLSFDEALMYRREFVPESSCLHFAKSPVCLERGRGQYLFDDKNCRYLDCFSSSSPVDFVGDSGVESQNRSSPDVGYAVTLMGDDKVPVEKVQKFLRVQVKVAPEVQLGVFDRNAGDRMRVFSSMLYAELLYLGHCHPDIVATGRKVFSHFLTRSTTERREMPARPKKRRISRRETEDGGTAQDISLLLEDLMSQLKARLPPQYDSFYFAKSGSEANDVAMFIARKYTGGSETLVIDQSHHGDLSAIAAVSARMFRRHRICPESWVHILPLPNDTQPDEMYISAKSLIGDLMEHGKKLCCLVCEPVFGLAGILTPPRGVLHGIVNMVRENGGLWIADEILTGLGRLGSHFWGFELLNCGSLCSPVYPDIITVGKPLGNGFPISLIITSSKIAEPAAMSLVSLSRPPLEGAIGATVLRVMAKEGLMKSAAKVGNLVKDKLVNLSRRHLILGDVRGQGLLVSVDVVTDKGSKLRNKVDALHLWYMLKDRRILCCLEGPDRSALMLQPPLCFTEADALDFVQALSDSVDALNLLMRPGPEIQNGNGSYLRYDRENVDTEDRIPDPLPSEQNARSYQADFGSLD